VSDALVRASHHELGRVAGVGRLRSGQACEGVSGGGRLQGISPPAKITLRLILVATRRVASGAICKGLIVTARPLVLRPVRLHRLREPLILTTRWSVSGQRYHQPTDRSTTAARDLERSD